MTKPARITQADMLRATMAAAEAHARLGIVVRIIFHLKTGKIETVIGGGPSSQELRPSEPNEWDDV